MLTVEQATRLRNYINAYACANYREAKYNFAPWGSTKEYEKRKKATMKAYDKVFNYLCSLTKEGKP